MVSGAELNRAAQRDFKSVSLIFDPSQTYASLNDLGSHLKLPPGWKFRVQMLDKDLVLTPDNGVAHITQDDLGNAPDQDRGHLQQLQAIARIPTTE